MDKIRHDCKFEAYASDIDGDILKTARATAERAGVGEYIKIFRADAANISKTALPDPNVRGTVVCNPPYGERMGEKREAEALYRRMSGAFRALLPWQIYILTSCDNFERLYGCRADKVKKLYNGMIPCMLYQYFKPKR